MPILTDCPSCRAKITAPDDLAGKMAKCSNCGGLLSIPAARADMPDWLEDHVLSVIEAPATPEPKPAARAAAPAPPKPRPKAARPDPGPAKEESPASGSFERLQIPARIRARVEKEVGSEKVVWVGRPSPEELLRKARPGPIFGIILILLAPASFGLLWLDALPDKRWIMQLSAAGLAVILTLFGLPLLFLPLLVRRFIHYRPVYVLTDRRAIVYRNIMVFLGKVLSYDRDALADMEVEVRDGGVGSIVMGYEEYHHQGRFTHKEDVRTSEDGRRKVVTTTYERKGEHTSHLPVGFLDVDDVREVEALIRRTLKLPAPRPG